MSLTGYPPLPKKNIFLSKLQTPVDCIYAIFHHFFLLPYLLFLFQLCLRHPELTGLECNIMTRDGLPALSTLSVGGLLPNPSWLYRSGDPVLLQEGEFAVFCLFGISSASDNGIWWSTGTDFGSFAFVNMPKSPDFIILECSHGLCWLLIKKIGLEWISWWRRTTRAGWRANTHLCLLIIPFSLHYTCGAFGSKRFLSLSNKRFGI